MFALWESGSHIRISTLPISVISLLINSTVLIPTLIIVGGIWVPSPPGATYFKLKQIALPIYPSSLNPFEHLPITFPRRDIPRLYSCLSGVTATRVYHLGLCGHSLHSGAYKPYATSIQPVVGTESHTTSPQEQDQAGHKAVLPWAPPWEQLSLR